MIVIGFLIILPETYPASVMSVPLDPFFLFSEIGSPTRDLALEKSIAEYMIHCASPQVFNFFFFGSPPHVAFNPPFLVTVSVLGFITSCGVLLTPPPLISLSQ